MIERGTSYKEIQAINGQIAQIQQKADAKIKLLAEMRDKIIAEQCPPFPNPYVKFKRGENEYLFKITRVEYLTTGEINYYVGKIITIKGEPYYHADYVASTSSFGENFQFLSKEEFEELLSKGLELIRKDIV